jgi:hypothetical protein
MSRKFYRDLARVIVTYRQYKRVSSWGTWRKFDMNDFLDWLESVSSMEGN